jgi:hypothetical protein
MSAYKDFLIGVEELVWTAREKGLSGADAVYAYVKTFEPKVDRYTIEAILYHENTEKEHDYRNIPGHY